MLPFQYLCLFVTEIAKSHSVPYEPDPDIMREDEVFSADEAMAAAVPEKPTLIDFGDFGNGPPLPSKGPNFPADQMPIGFNYNNAPQEPNFYAPAPVHMNQPGPHMPGQPPIGQPPGGYSVPPNFAGGAGYPPAVPPPSAPEKPLLHSQSVPPAAPASRPSNSPATGGPPPNYDSIIGKNPIRPTPLPRGQGPNKTSPDGFPDLPEVPNFSPDSDDKNVGGGVGADSKDESIDFEDLAARFEALKKRK